MKLPILRNLFLLGISLFVLAYTFSFISTRLSTESYADSHYFEFADSRYFLFSDMASNDQNEFLISGETCGPVDLDLTEGVDIQEETAEFCPETNFVSKYLNDGSYAFSLLLDDGYTYGGGFISAIDEAGNVIVANLAEGTVDLDATEGVDMYTTTRDVYVSKYTSDGSYVDTAVTHTTSTLLRIGVKDITTDMSGNIYFTGTFLGQTDFDPDPIETDIYSPVGGSDTYIVKYGPDLSYQWVKIIGGADYEEPTYIDVDDNGEFTVFGRYNGTTDFDPDPVGEDIRTTSYTYDTFLTHYSSDGTYEWTITIPNTYGALGLSVADDGTIYSVGTFEYLTDFDPGPGVFEMDAGEDYYYNYVAKYTAEGTFIDAWMLEATVDQDIKSMVVDSRGSMHFVMKFFGTVDFDPGPGVEERTSSGGSDLALLSLEDDKSFGWVYTAGAPRSPDIDYPEMIILSDDTLLITGQIHYYPVDFDPSGSISWVNGYEYDSWFFVKMHIDDISPLLNISADSILTGTVNPVVVGYTADKYIGDYVEVLEGESDYRGGGAAMGWTSDDAYWEYSFPDMFTFPFYGTNYTSAYIGSNGRICFDSGSILTTGTFRDESCGSFLSPLWTDITYPNPGDGIYITEGEEEVTVRWEGAVTAEGAESDYVGGGTIRNVNDEEVPLYMDFPFYGETYSSVWPLFYDVDGAIFFDGRCDETVYCYSGDLKQTLFGPFISPYWQYPLSAQDFYITRNWVGEPTGVEEFSQTWNGDNSVWTLDLPFTFPFYGTGYDSVYVNSNGQLCFTYADCSDYTYAGDMSITGYGPFIAPLWQDLRTYGDAQSGEDIFITEETDFVMIRWRAQDYDDEDGLNFEVELHSDGTIKFNYGEHRNAPFQSGATVGVSLGDGIEYTASTHNDLLNYDELNSVVFTYNAGSYDETVLGTNDFWKDGTIEGVVDNVVFRWYFYDDGTLPVREIDYEAILYPNGNIKFNYGVMENERDYWYTPTIGVSSGDAFHYTETMFDTYLINQHVLDLGTMPSMLFTYDSEFGNYDVTYSSDGVPVSTDISVEAVLNRSGEITYNYGGAYDLSDIQNPPLVGMSRGNGGDQFVKSSINQSRFTLAGPTSYSYTEGGLSNIARVEYQIEGVSEDWTECTVTDGSYDTPTEDFTCEIDGSELTQLTSLFGSGTYTVYIRSHDVMGNISDPYELTIVLGDSPPEEPSATPLVVSTVAGETYTGTAITTDDSTPTFTGTAAANESVTIVITGPGGTLIGSTTADGAGNWDWTPGVNLDDGTYTVTITAEDGVGGTDSESFTLIVDTGGGTTGGTTTPPGTPGGTVSEDEGEDENADTAEEGDGDGGEVVKLKDIEEFLDELLACPAQISWWPYLSILIIGLLSVLKVIGFSLADLPYYFHRSRLGILYTLGVRAKAKPWGVVYDSISKKLLSRSIVRLYNQAGELVDTEVTDVNGVFSFEPVGGTYRMDVQCSGYEFPSMVVRGNTDGPRKYVYNGGDYEVVGDRDPVRVYIPMDRKDLNPLIGIVVFALTKVIEFLTLISPALLLIGLWLSVYYYRRDGGLLHVLMFAVYMILLLMYVVGWLKERGSWGYTVNDEGYAMPGVELGLYDDTYQRLIDTRISDEKGRFRFVVVGGEYVIRPVGTAHIIDEPGYEGGYVVGRDVKDEQLIKERVVVRKSVKMQ